MARVLIAEDDRVIANAMATHLRRAGMDVEIAEDGERAMRKLRFLPLRRRWKSATVKSATMVGI